MLRKSLTVSISRKMSIKVTVMGMIIYPGHRQEKIRGHLIGICLSKGTTGRKDSTKKNHHNDVRKQGKPRLNTLGKQSYQDRC